MELSAQLHGVWLCENPSFKFSCCLLALLFCATSSGVTIMKSGLAMQLTVSPFQNHEGSPEHGLGLEASPGVSPGEPPHPNAYMSILKMLQNVSHGRSVHSLIALPTTWHCQHCCERLVALTQSTIKQYRMWSLLTVLWHAICLALLLRCGSRLQQVLKDRFAFRS